MLLNQTPGEGKKPELLARQVVSNLAEYFFVDSAEVPGFRFACPGIDHPSSFDNPFSRIESSRRFLQSRLHLGSLPYSTKGTFNKVG
jgi:hypothetical protein